MNRIGKLLRLIAGIALAAFAAPSLAADKQYTVTVVQITPTKYEVTYTNFKDGNSYINSLALTVPNVNITSATLVVSGGGGGGKPPPPYQPAPDTLPSYISFVDIVGLKPGATGKITMEVGPLPACSFVTVQPEAYSGNTLGGVLFQLLPSNLALGSPCSGEINCNQSTVGAFGLDVFRGNNKNLSACSLTTIKETNCITNGTGCPGGVVNSYLFEWGSNQPAATFNYPVVFQPEPDASPLATKVAWPAVPGGPITMTPVVAQVCLANTHPSLPQRALPASYGKLGGDISATDTLISIMADIGAPTPIPPPTTGEFPIVIGNERLRVQYSGTGTVYTVLERGVADTNPAAHVQNDRVASTPFPLRTVGTVTTIDRMCMSEIITEVVPWGSGSCTGPWNGVSACVRLTIFFSDGGDGFTLRQ